MRNNQYGFSLVQVLIAIAMAGGLSLIILKLQENSGKIIKNAETSQSIQELMAEVTSNLSSTASCSETFQNRIISPTPASIPTLKKVLKRDGSVYTFLEANKEYPEFSVKVENITYSETIDEFLELEIHFTKLHAGSIGGKNITKKMKLNFQKNALNRITSCGASVVGAMQIVPAEKPGVQGKTGDQACQEIGKECLYVTSYNFIKEDAHCMGSNHCMRICTTNYNQSLPGVQNSVGNSDHDNIHDCTARLGEHTTYLHVSVVRCNAFFSAVCQ